MRVITKIGDVFTVKIDERSKKYFQYIVNDLTQLNSDVIRAFKKVYSIEDNPSLAEIIMDEVAFYAHCITKLGVKMGYWEKVGNIREVGTFGHVFFRSTNDYGNPSIKVSHDWWIWKINREQVRVGKLVGPYRNAEIGVVKNPKSIVHRMRTGKYDGIYPDFE
jgi:hypothetical protein